MKLLQTEFTSAPDKSKEQRFIQVKRSENVALYRRETMDKVLVHHEVFEIKKRYKGQTLPGGVVEAEDRESYPGAASGGKSTWYPLTQARGEELFDIITAKLQTRADKKQAKEDSEDVE